MENTEIEIRIFLEDYNPILNWLKVNAELIKTSKQSDYYFEHPNRPFIYIDSQGEKNADDWLRVRFGKNNEVCYKKWHRDKRTGKSLYADEIETSVQDAKKLIQILESLGFKKISTIKKRRESWQYNNFQFDCDDVEGLGFFVEIEYKGEVDDPAKGRGIITDFLAEIGIKDWKIIKRGYPWMQWNPNVNHFEK